MQSGDPQFAHYGGPLHVKVETTAAPAVAYQRVAGVLDVLSQLLVPVSCYFLTGKHFLLLIYLGKRYSN